MTDREKIRLFYEIALEVVGIPQEDFNELDPDMQNLFEYIANVVNDIENL